MTPPRVVPFAAALARALADILDEVGHSNKTLTFTLVVTDVEQGISTFASSLSGEVEVAEVLRDLVAKIDSGGARTLPIEAVLPPESPATEPPPSN